MMWVTEVVVVVCTSVTALTWRNVGLIHRHVRRGVRVDARAEAAVIHRIRGATLQQGVVRQVRHRLHKRRYLLRVALVDGPRHIP